MYMCTQHCLKMNYHHCNVQACNSNKTTGIILTEIHTMCVFNFPCCVSQSRLFLVCGKEICFTITFTQTMYTVASWNIQTDWFTYLVMETMHQKSYQHVSVQIIYCCPLDVGHGINEVNEVSPDVLLSSLLCSSCFNMCGWQYCQCSEVLDEKG